MSEFYDLLNKRVENLSSVAAQDGMAATRLLTNLASLARGNTEYSAALITKGLDVVPAIAAQDGWAATNLVSDLATFARDNAEHSAAVIDKGLDIVPTVAAQNGWAATELVSDLATFARGNAEHSAAVIAKGLDAVPTVAAQNGWAATRLLANLATLAGVENGRGFVCKDFMISDEGGRDKRQTLVMFGTTAEDSVVTTGCFKGNLLELRAAVEDTHPLGSAHRDHYDDVVNTAFGALANRETLPSFKNVPQVKGQTLTAS